MTRIGEPCVRTGETYIYHAVEVWIIGPRPQPVTKVERYNCNRESSRGAPFQGFQGPRCNIVGIDFCLIYLSSWREHLELDFSERVQEYV